MIKREWKNIFHNTWIKIVLVAIMIIPSIYACVFLGSMWDPYGNTSEIPVAVVNEDQSVVYNDTSLSVGEELVKNLKENNSMDFCFVTKDEAMSGLSNGTYYMVITIPGDFSKNATTLLDEQPQKMVLNYTTNPGTNYIASKMDDSAITKIKEQVSASVTQTYAKTIFSQIETLSSGLFEAADGSKQLSEGISQLSAGNTTILDNLKVLASSSLTFNDGASTLSLGLQDYTNGVVSVNDGMVSLKDGLDTLNLSSNTLSQGVNQLDSGASSLVSGIGAYTGGVNQVYAALQQATAQNDTLLNGVDTINDSTAALVSGNQQVTTALNTLGDTLKNSLTQDKLNDIQKVISSNDTLVQAEQLLTKLMSLDSNLAKDWLTQPLTQNQLNSLSLSLQEKAMLQSYSYHTITTMTSSNNQKVIQELSQSIQKVNGAINGTTLPDGGYQSGLVQGSKQVQEGLTALNKAIDTNLKTGLNAYTSGIEQISEGLEKVTANNESLISGSQQLADGMHSLSNQTPTLVSGISALDQGANQIYDGTQTLVSNQPTLLKGMEALKQGAFKISDGSSQLADGSSTLQSGLDEASSGVTTLNQRLEEGANQSQMSIDDDTFDMIASPVTTDHQEISVVENNGHAMAPYMMSVALYVAGLAFTLMYPVLEGVKESESGFKYWLSKAGVAYTVSTLAAIIMVTCLRIFNGFAPQMLLQTYLFAILVAAAFMSIILLLNVTTGYIGEFLLLVFMVINLGGSAGTYPIETSGAIFKAIHNFVPYTYSVNGFRKTISIAGANLSTETLVFLGILIVCSLATILYYQFKKDPSKHLIAQAFEKHE